MADVTLSGVSKAFGSTVAVDDMSLQIPDGAFFVLLGPTGAGKTTTLRLIAGLETPESGDIRIGDRSVLKETPAQRNVAMVFQQYSLYPHMTVRENLAFPLRSPMLQTPEDEIERKITEVAEVLRIPHKLDNKATALSGGEMQRVSIGRALVRRPDIYLMDEPLSSLDAALRAELRVELKRIQADLGATMLYVTHDQIEAMTMATHVGVLDSGKLVQVGSPREIYEDPVSLYVAGRLGLPRINTLPADLFGGAPSGAATIGLRPEHIVQGDGKPAAVVRVEHLGDQTRLHLSLEGCDLVTLTDVHTPLEPGDTVAIHPRNPLYFDADGQRIRQGGTMKQFINTKETLVTEAIDGTLRTSGGRLARLDGYPHIKVVVRTDWDKSKVALVSGGGSGHEPSHAGFVGQGMLTAAVCGEVFASPSVDAVLAGILAVTGKAGCLLIVKNYTGDRLNFGLAAERARAQGLKVAMVIVDDDIALPDLPQARGVAGTLFVHKIAGALAEQGADLDTVADAAERVVKGVVSIGMSLDTCTIPGSPKEDRIAAGKAELGLGIHGEPGIEQVSFSNAKTAMEMVVDRLAPNLGSGPHTALLNNLGGSTPLEMAVLAEELMRSRIGGRIRAIVGPAAMMTSLDMQGFSVSLLPTAKAEDDALRAPVAPSAWPGCVPVSEVATQPLPDGLTPIQPIASKNDGTRAFIERCCNILIEAEADLNALDAKSGDGDTGSTLATASRALIGALDRLPLADQTQLYRAIGQELSQTMGGSSGVLLAIFFAAAGDASASGKDVIGALKAGLDRVQQVGGARLGDRTMIDALFPALEALHNGVQAAARAAREGADATAKITRARAGRASYIAAESLAGHNDPGAEAVARLFEKLSDAQQAAV